MSTKEAQLLEMADSLGCRRQENKLYGILDWLRENKQIHLEVGSIWNERTNYVESYYYSLKRH